MDIFFHTISSAEHMRFLDKPSHTFTLNYNQLLFNPSPRSDTASPHIHLPPILSFPPFKRGKGKMKKREIKEMWKIYQKSHSQSAVHSYTSERRSEWSLFAGDRLGSTARSINYKPIDEDLNKQLFFSFSHLYHS